VSIIEYPVVEDLTFQVWDSATTPAISYAWLGAANASPSTQAVNGAVTRTNFATDPHATKTSGTVGYWGTGGYGTGGAGSYTLSPAGASDSGSAAVMTWTATPTAGGAQSALNITLPTAPTVDTVMTFSLEAMSNQTLTNMSLITQVGSSSLGGAAVTLTAGIWTRLSLTRTVPAGTTSLVIGVRANSLTASGVTAGTVLSASRALIEASFTVGEYFDGFSISTPASNGDWRDLAEQAVSVSTRRGGQQNGASTAIQAGTLDATLYGVNNLATETALRPNSPIRVVRPAPDAERLWNLTGNGTAAMAMAQVPQPSPIGMSSNIGNTNASFAWNDGATGSINMPQGTLLLGTNAWRLTAPTNTRPDVFDTRKSYVLYANGYDFAVASGLPRNARMALVIYTGSPNDPSIIAQGDPREYALNTYTNFPPVRFTAPEGDWQVGVVLVDAVSASGLQTASVNAVQSVNIAQVEVWTDDELQPEFTGTIADLSQTVNFDKATGQKEVFTTISAVDAVQSLANTDRFGAVSASGVGYQPWADRIAQLSTSALVPVQLPGSANTTFYIPAPAGTDQWVARGGVQPPMTTATTSALNGSITGTWGRTSGSTSAASWTPRIDHLWRSWDTSSTYAFSVTVAVSAVGATATDLALSWTSGKSVITSDTVAVPDTGTVTLGLQFTPSSAVGTLAVSTVTPATFTSGTGTRSLGITLTNISVVRIGDPRGYQLMDTGLQSNLAAHYDLACATTGARWWVSRENVVQFARDLDQTPRLSLSDAADGDISYTDVGLSFDTANTVNVLKINNHGYDRASGNTADNSVSFASNSSIRRWGARSGELDMSMWTGPGHETDLARRAQEVMSDLARPTYEVKSLTFNVRSDPSVMDEMDLYRMVRVSYEDLSQTCRILSISQNITPTRWTVSLTFTDIQSGPTFADLTASFSGTVSDFNTAYAGKSVRDFNADPIPGD
jgi:hypothetical protein